MNVWVGVGAVVALILLIAIVVGTRRAPNIEDELNPKKRGLARIATPASLNQASFRDLLRSIQAGRRTGTLQVTADGQRGSLYFLYGHLFHAESGTLAGEAALQACMEWSNVQYAFDAESKLPLAETIERPMDQILTGT